MKVALVHDYIKEMGGAERVLRVLSEMYPKAPIYTAFAVYGSAAEKDFRDKIIKESWLAPLLKIGKLYSPLRFLIPLIWGSFDLSAYDLVITSCSWYITRGFKVGPKTKVVAYCHTPPRWLYGYETSVNFQKYWPVRVYASVVGHFLRMYDFKTAQQINYWISNSNNIAQRIFKFYRKKAVTIYPPIYVEEIIQRTKNIKNNENKKYFLIVSRLVGAKGIENAINAFKSQSTYKLVIVGEAAGYSDIETKYNKKKDSIIKFTGRVNDEKLWELYSNAYGFIALAHDEDFGMTVVEAQAAGTPIIAYNGGGFKESVVDGKTGVFVDSDDKKSILNAVKRFEKIKWNKSYIVKNARRFSKEQFINDFNRYIKRSVIGKG